MIGRNVHLKSITTKTNTIRRTASGRIHTSMMIIALWITTGGRKGIIGMKGNRHLIVTIKQGQSMTATMQEGISHIKKILKPQ